MYIGQLDSAKQHEIISQSVNLFGKVILRLLRE